MFDVIPFEHRRRNALYNPFRDWEDLEKAFFGRSEMTEFKTDIRDLGDAYQLEAELPGFKKEEIKVDLNGQYLSIHAEHQSASEEKDEQGSYIRRERSFGSYSRSFDVSQIRSEEISASYADGVLTMRLPKKEAAAPGSRSITVE